MELNNLHIWNTIFTRKMTCDDLEMAMMETKLIDQYLDIYPCWSGGYDSKQ